MEIETQIQLKVNSMLDERFEGYEREVVVHPMNDGSFKVYITSSDSSFIAQLIGKKGSVITRFKGAFQNWAFEQEIRAGIWVEKHAVKKPD